MKAHHPISRKYNTLSDKRLMNTLKYIPAEEDGNARLNILLGVLLSRGWTHRDILNDLRPHKNIP